MGRAPCCEKVGLKRGRWTAEEDQLLVDYIKAHGEGGWRSLPKNAGLLRCGKSCRLRWVNYLREDLKRGNISPEEEETILKLQATLGNRWSLIAGHLPGRTDNEIKNYWNAHLSKKVAARMTAEEADSDGGGDQPGSPSHHDDDGGEVCSEDARSTVVDAEKYGHVYGSDDCATSCVPPKRNRKRKDKDKVTEHKTKEKKTKKEKEKSPLKAEATRGAGGTKKRKRKPCVKDGSGSDNDTCDCHLKKDEKTAAVAVDNDPAENVSGKEPNKKRKKKKPKLAEQAAGTGATSATVDEVGASSGELRVVTASEAKGQCEPDVDASCGAACSDAAGYGPEDLGPAAHVEHGVKTANGDAALDGSGHVEEDTGMDLDLLEGIDSDTGFLGLITGISADPHGGMLLDYLAVSGGDGACCWDGAPLVEEEGSATCGWPDSAAGSGASMVFGSKCIVSPASGSTTSSYVNLDEGRQLRVDGSPAAEDGIGSLPWESEDDLWRLLFKFVEDIDAEAGDQRPQLGPQQLQQQQQPETMQGFLSSIGSCGDDVFTDGCAFDNPWLLADTFLS